MNVALPEFSNFFFHMWRLCCHYLFPISPSFGASGRLCFVTVEYLGYLHLYFSGRVLFETHKISF